MTDNLASNREKERLTKILQAALKGRSGNMELTFENRYFVIQAIPVNIRSDESVKIMFLSQDITELKKNRIKLKTAMNAANLIVSEYDFQSRTVASNKALCELLEINGIRALSEADIIDKLHPEDVAIRKKDLKNAVKTGKINHEVRFVLESGIKHLRITGKVMFGNGKKPVAAYGIIQDVTSDLELLYQVKASEERFRLIADSAPVTIWITDKDDRCTYINQTWLEYTGSDLEDCLNDGWLKYIHPEDQRRAMQTFMSASDNREPFELEYMVEDKDGNYGWFLNRAHPMFDKDGQFAGFVGSNVDITDQKKFSRELEKKVGERTEELELSNTELVRLNMNLEEYAYVASHDLQEPVRKIRMFNSMLMDNRESEKFVQKYGRKIESSAARMSELIKSVLEYGKLNQDTLRKETVNLDKVLEEIHSELELMTEEQNVTIEGKNLGKVSGARIHIYQLLSNLIRNGIKFNEEKPQIALASETVQGKNLKTEFPTAKNRTYRKLIVSDNGIGIPEDQLDNIFKPFKRLHSREQYSGTGIGLAVCKRIVGLHYGFIKVESEVGQGTAFTIYLPSE